MSSAATSPNQIGNYRFMIEINDVAEEGTIAGHFRSMSGLSSKQEVIEYRMGGDRSIRRKPGRVSFSNLVLEKGFTNDDEAYYTLFDWHREMVNGDKSKKDGSIVMLDHNGNERIRWNFFNAWPVSWEGPGLAAGAGETAIEKLELAVEWVELA
jgi:phage tail-like protein